MRKLAILAGVTFLLLFINAAIGLPPAKNPPRRRRRRRHGNSNGKRFN